MGCVALICLKIHREKSRVMISDNISFDHLKYCVGPLLYMPALRNDIAEKIISFKKYKPVSIAICLEDTIRDDMVRDAEKNMAEQIKILSDMMAESGSYDDLPLVFIRVRSPWQIAAVIDMLGENISLVCGFILPKIDDIVFSEYVSEIVKIKRAGNDFCYMPIIENASLLSLKTRYDKLQRLHDMMAALRDCILNIRVGGNDFSGSLAIRNSISQTVYDIIPVADLLSDIAVTFTGDYVVSAPVWNYFDNGTDHRWRDGLSREMILDRSMGFVGKTVIHPSQIPVVIENMKVSRQDLRDARLILDTADNDLQVIKSTEGNRMYEHKVHRKWAERIIEIASVYGAEKDREL